MAVNMSIDKSTLYQPLLGIMPWMSSGDYSLSQSEWEHWELATTDFTFNLEQFTCSKRFLWTFPRSPKQALERTLTSSVSVPHLPIQAAMNKWLSPSLAWCWLFLFCVLHPHPPNEIFLAYLLESGLCTTKISLFLVCFV